MTSSADRLHDAIAHGPMSPLQITTVVICLAINLIDGFDVLAISFTASTLAAEWQLQDDQLGLLISAGVAGMTIASILISPVADYIGRRRTILFSLAVITLGMVASAMAMGPADLALYRFATGLGIGTLLPSINTMVGEFSSHKRRELAVTIMQAGFPLGATLGGFVAFGLIESLGWRGVFWVGALLSGAMIPLSWRGLPESPDFLRTGNINAVLTTRRTYPPCIKVVRFWLEMKLPEFWGHRRTHVWVFAAPRAGANWAFVNSKPSASMPGLCTALVLLI